MSFYGGRGRSNILGDITISLDISTSIVSESIAMLSADTDSSGTGEVLRLNSGD